MQYLQTDYAHTGTVRIRYTWKYCLLLALLALLTVCTFEAKSMTLTAAVHTMLSDGMNRKIGLDGTLRYVHPPKVTVVFYL